MQRAVIGTNADEVIDACVREGFPVPAYTISLSELHIGSTWTALAIVAFGDLPTTTFVTACLEYVVTGKLYHGETALFAPGPGDKLQRLMPLH